MIDKIDNTLSLSRNKLMIGPLFTSTNLLTHKSHLFLLSLAVFRVTLFGAYLLEFHERNDSSFWLL